MKRVMIVTSSLTGGGAERSMNLVSNELTKRGWPIALVPINSSEPDLVTPICDVFPLHRQWRSSIFDTISAIVKFNRLVRSWKPDVIILNCDLPELFGTLLFGRKVLVAVEHSNIAWINRTKLGKAVRRILSIRRAQWVAVSSHLKIWPYGHTPQAVIQNPLTPVIETLEKFAPTSDIRRLIFIGRLSPEKQPEYLLEISRQTGLPAEIIGDGFLKQSLQARVAESELAVTFHGHIRDPWSIARSGDLLIISSSSEGDGLVAIEGMERGIPQLLSDIPDFRRFNLPERNYCRNVNDFTERIKEFHKKLLTLMVPEDISKSILSSRSSRIIGDEWEKFLRTL